MQKKNGISLIVLVITILIMIILASIVIISLNNSGIIEKTNMAVSNYNTKQVEEQIKEAYLEYKLAQYSGTTENINEFIKNRLTNVFGNVDDVNKRGNSILVTFSNGKIYTCNLLSGKTTDITNTTNISKDTNENFVGCYADIDADGIVDGVIFADMLVGNTKNNDAYEIPKEEANDLKDYYISQESYKWANTTIAKPVLSPKGNGNERFYILMINDFSVPERTGFAWYRNATGKMSDYSTLTSEEFGTGRNNTENMIKKWNASGKEGGYANVTKDDRDIWKYIQGDYSDGWFLPSKEELIAFFVELEINLTGSASAIFNTYGLSVYYTSSSLASAWYYYKISVGLDITAAPTDSAAKIRLATIF